MARIFKGGILNFEFIFIDRKLCLYNFKADGEKKRKILFARRNIVYAVFLPNHESAKFETKKLYILILRDLLDKFFIFNIFNIFSLYFLLLLWLVE